ncbi:MAG: hypothetical protein KJ601_07500, partial [Nanoarchaeota archaeon]|nr:hypothetical protein [Nanoarchaeota archaeon]
MKKQKYYGLSMSEVAMPAAIALIIFILFAIFITGPSFTGYTTIDVVGERFALDEEYNWEPSLSGVINSVSLNGKYSGSARVYLDDGKDVLLLLNTNNLAPEQNYVNGDSGDLSLSLEYNDETSFDIDDNGVESSDGIVDIRVMAGNISTDKLCTKWEVYSYDGDLTQSVCYGASSCCAFLDMESSGEWDDVFYLNKGKLGAGIYNKVSARLVYADYDLSIPYVNVSYSDWYSLKANFIPALIPFEDVCEESCSGLSLDDGSYILDVKVDGELWIDDVVYGVEEVAGIMGGYEIMEDLAAPRINFTYPTPINRTRQSKNWTEINVSITEEDLKEVKYNWNGTNFTMYDDSLVLMYNFDYFTGLNDTSKYGNNGTNNGSTWNSSGKYGGAYSFDGVDDYAYVLDTDDLDFTDNFSTCLWYKANSGYSNAHIISKLADNAASGWRIASSSSPSFYMRDDNSNVISASFIGLSLNSWNYVCFSFVASTKTVYLYSNGKYDRSQTNINLVLSELPNIGDITLGCREKTEGSKTCTTTSSYFNGSIDEVRIWNRSLSSDEVYQQYVSNLYKFNQTQWYLYVNQSKNATAGLSVGNYTYQAFASDTSGNWNSTDLRTIEITEGADTTAPAVYLVSPANNSIWTSSSTVNFTFNVSDDSNINHCNLTAISSYPILTSASSISYDGNYVIYTFNSNGTFNVSSDIPDVEIIVVAGGGSGGAGENGLNSGGGGGGAGGVIYNSSYAITSGNHNIIVGQGGTGSSKPGQNSSFGSLVAIGGGYGAPGNSGGPNVGGSGGSGGGGGRDGAGGAGTVGQGHDGGASVNTDGGGGGGCGSAGSGRTNGAGCSYLGSVYGAGGLGGEGNNPEIVGATGAANTGNGGGGGSSGGAGAGGGNGGSGTVIIKVLNPVYRGSNSTIIKDTNQTFSMNLTNGDYIWNVNCTDEYDNVGSSEIYNFTLNYDWDAPKLTIVSPTATTYATNSIWFNVSADKILSYCKYTFDDWNTNVTMSALNNTYYYNLTTVFSGSYIARFWCNDTNGYVNNTESVAFTIDAPGPAIRLVAPANNSIWVYSNLVNFTYNVSSAISVNHCNLTVSSSSISASGGNITYDGDYIIYTFNSNGTFNTSYPISDVEVLVVGGGGSGGPGDNGGNGGGGGGGAGGVIYNSSYLIVSGNHDVVIGNGGAASSKRGGNSSFGDLVGVGGGYGADGSYPDVMSGGNGGSGGGGSRGGTGGNGTTGQGNNGGTGTLSGPGGGGGGCGSAGSDQENGSGCIYFGSTYGVGGRGGGSSVPGVAGSSGAANTGNGGGGGSYGDTFIPSGGSGGSGVIKIKFLNPIYRNSSSSIIKDTNQTLSLQVPDGGYLWDMACTDEYNNLGESERFNLSVSYLQAEITAPLINFTYPTPGNGTNQIQTSFEVNVSITESSLGQVVYNWNGTIYTMYNDSLVLMMNFDNRSSLNETAGHIADLSLYGNNGTWIGDLDSDSGSTNEGRFSGAFLFDGVGDDEVQINHDPSQWIGNNGAVSAWVKTSYSSKSQYIIHKFSHSEVAGGDDPNANRGYIFGLNATGSVFFAIGDASSSNTAFSTNSVSDGSWHHLIGTYNGSVIKVYIDGVENGNASSTKTAYPTTEKLVVGGVYEIIPDREFHGSIDEIRIWKRSLSVAEAYQQYASNLVKYNTTHWHLYVNQSKNATDGLDLGAYTYQAFAEDNSGNLNFTDLRSLTIYSDADTTFPQINFTNPTPANGTQTSITSIIVNVSIIESELNDIVYNWNGTNFTIYNDSLVLLTNLNNNSNLGESASLVVDSAGNYNSTAVSATVNTTDCIYGNCFTFDGASEIDLSDIDVSYITVSAWIKTDSSSVFGIVSEHETSGSAGRSYTLRSYQNRLEMEVYTPTFGWWQGTTLINDGEWHHVVGTWDGSDVDLYLDGVKEAINGQAGSPSGALQDVNQNTAIGNYNDGSDHYFDGNIDEVQIWDKALTDEQIFQMYFTNLKKFNSTQWYLYINQSQNATDGLSVGNYTYQAFAADTSGNWNLTEVRSVEIVEEPPLTVILNDPIDNNNTVGLFGNVILNCSAEDGNNLANITLYHNINGIWEANGTENISGTSNSTIFTIDITEIVGNTAFKDSTYNWNCYACDSLNCTFASSNYSFSGWDLGTYINTSLNYSYNYISLTPNSSNMYPNNNGTYTSQIFNATYTALFRNISWDVFNPNFYDNFEYDTIGEKPVNFSVSEPAGTSVRVMDCSSFGSGKCLIINQSVESAAVIGKSFGPVSKGSLALSVRKTDTDSTYSLIYVNGQGKGVGCGFLLRFYAGGIITAQSVNSACGHISDFGQIYMGYAANQWYDINITFDVTGSTDKWNVYINGEHKGDVDWNQGFDFDKVTSTTIGGYWSGTPTTYVDNVSTNIDSSWNIPLRTRACSQPDCSDGVYGNYSTNSTLTQLSQTGQYFQYQTQFNSKDIYFTPKLLTQSVKINFEEAAPVTYPQINFTPPTPANGTQTSNTSVEINVSISDSNLNEVKYNWNGTNFTMYDNSLVLMMNFDNRSTLGEKDYGIDNLTADLSKYGNDGIIYGANWTSDGIYGGAFEFDGIDDYINLGESSILNFEDHDFAVGAWFKADPKTNGILIGRTDENTQRQFFIQARSGANGYIEVEARTMPGLNVICNPNSGLLNPINDGGWHHLIFVLDDIGSGTECSLYLDGVNSTFGTASSNYRIKQTNVDLRIGAIETGPFFNGTIDEVRIWNRSLSANEVYQQYISNLQKYNSTQWYLYVNQSKNSTAGLDVGSYTYFASAKDAFGNENITEVRSLEIVEEQDITPPSISFIPPTPDNGNVTSNTNLIVNVSINENVSSCKLYVDYTLGDGSDGELIVTSANTVVNDYAYLTGNELAGDTVITLNSASAFSTGDEILVLQTQNASGDAGWYEFATVSSISGNNLTLNSGLANSYHSGSFNLTSSSSTQIIRVPHYTDIAINSGASITALAWDGYKGGIVVFRAKGIVNVSGTINTTAKGFRGGIGGAGGVDGQQGESYNGLGIVDNSAANLGGGAGGNYANECTGGAGGSYGSNGGSGQLDANWPSGGTSPAGATYGLANISRIYLGSAGGGGARYTAPNGYIANGGNGGGIILIYSDQIIVPGTVTSIGGIGGDSGHDYSSNGGSGSGGTVYLSASLINITGSVNATGGLAQTGTAGNGDGGSGGEGRIRLDSNFLSGTTSPISGYNGTFANVIYNMTIYNADANTWASATTNLDIGNHTYFASCTDLSGNSNSTEERTLTIVEFTDTISPVINFTIPTPADGALINYNDVTINITSSENVSSCVLNWQGIPDEYTSLLLSFDGPDGSTDVSDFIDSSVNNHTVSIAGSTSLSDTQKVFGLTSLYTDSSDDYVSVSASDGWAFGTEDFTVDFWIYEDVHTSDSIVGTGYGAGEWNVYIYGGGSQMTWWWQNILVLESSIAIQSDQWYHIAFVRKDGTLTLYMNGINRGSAVWTANVSKIDNLIIGTDGTNYLNGYLDELRISKGIARWTSNFAVPASPYSNYNFTMSINNADANTTANATVSHLLDNRYYYYSVWCNDTSSNTNSTETRSFIIDTASPGIEFISPTPDNGTSTTNTSIEINVSIVEENLANVTYNWNGTNFTMYDDGLVLMMNLDNVSAIGENATKAVDVSKYGNNGTVVNAVWNASGKYRGSYSFDGAEDYVSINPFAHGDSVSFSAWINPASFIQYSVVVADYNWTSGLLIDLGSADGKIRWRGICTEEFTVEGSASETWAGNNKWHYVVGTFNGSRAELYYDGIFNNNASGSGCVFNHELVIGARYYGGGYEYFFNGSIDEVRIWNRSLSAEEIYQQYISNLAKFNSTQWYLYVNQSRNATAGLIVGNYTYQAFASDVSGNWNSTEERTVKIMAGNPILQPSYFGYTFNGSIDGNLTNGTAYLNDQLIDLIDNDFGIMLSLMGYFSQGPVDLRNLTIGQDEHRTVVNLTHVSGVSLNHTLYVDNTRNAGVFVCPHAERLDQVVEGCPDIIYFTHAQAITGTRRNNILVTLYNDKYKVANLTGSGISESVYPKINFTDPTPGNATNTSNRWVEVNVSIEEDNLEEVLWNWNGTNFTIYNDSLVLIMNLDKYTMLNDTSIYSRNGSCTTCPTFTEAGRHNGAYTFAGADDSITVDDNPVMDMSGSFTFGGYFKLNGLDAFEAILTKRGGNNNANLNYFLYTGTLSSNKIRCLTRAAASSVDSTFDVQTGVWYHVLCVQDAAAGKLKLYVDGALDNQADLAGSDVNSDDPLYIGNDDNSDDFNGEIDEIRIWNRSLSAIEVYQQYASNLHKFNSTHWYLTVNQSKNASALLDYNENYTYYACAADFSENENCTETRQIEILEPRCRVKGTITDSYGSYVASEVQILNATGAYIVNSTEDYDLDVICDKKYNIVVKPKESNFNSIKLNNVTIREAVSEFVQVENNPLGMGAPDTGNFTEAVTWNPNATLNYTSVTINFTYQGFNLTFFKCLSWNFTARNCTNDNWTYIEDVPDSTSEPAYYVRTFMPGDPAAGVVNSTRIVRYIEVYDVSGLNEADRRDDGTFVGRYENGTDITFDYLKSYRIELYLNNTHKGANGIIRDAYFDNIPDELVVDMSGLDSPNITEVIPQVKINNHNVTLRSGSVPGTNRIDWNASSANRKVIEGLKTDELVKLWFVVDYVTREVGEVNISFYGDVSDTDIDVTGRNAFITQGDVYSPYINFTAPTPVDGASITNRSFIANVSISNNLKSVIWDFNGTNYTMYNDSLVLMMNFDNRSDLGENDTVAKDMSGNGNHPTWYGDSDGNSAYEPKGKYGGAFAFDGSGDYFVFPDSPDWDFGSNNFTMQLWINMSSYASYNYFLSSSNNGGPGWLLDYAGGNVRLFSTWFSYVQVPASLPTNTWYHLTVVKDGNAIRFYKDGVQIGTDQIAAATYNSDGNGIYVCYEQSDPTRQFTGKIDEIRIWNGHGMSDEEVYQSYVSNLNKFNSTQWYLYVNQSKNATTLLDYNDYTYYACAEDTSGNRNCTEARDITISHIAGYDGCGILDIENHTYTLAADVSSAGTCFTIAANNVTLDCAGHLINYSQSVTGYGVNNSGYDYTTVMNCEIVQGGTGLASHSISLSNVYTATIFNSSTYTLTGDDYGILISSSSKINLSENEITSLNADAIQISNGDNNSITNNNINASNGIWGVHIMAGSSNNHLISNSIFSGGSGVRIYDNSNNNELQDNNVTAVGTALTIQGIPIGNFADNNSVSRNNLTSTSEDAVTLIGFASNNIFINNSLGANQNSIELSVSSGGFPENNNFTNNNLNHNGFALTFLSEGINFTYLIDQQIRNYSFAGKGGIVIVKNSSAGEIRMLMNGSGDDFSSNISVRNNTAFVDSTNSGLNRSANITFYNIGSFVAPVILRNGVGCNANTVPSCYNLSNLNAGTVIFNVSYWSEYSIGEEATQNIISSCTNITEPGDYILNQSISSDGSCLRINASNVTLDCLRYNITYGKTAVGYGINATENLTGIVIENCDIRQGAKIGNNNYGIFFDNVNNSVIRNCTINATGITFVYGISTVGGRSITFENNRISANCTTSYCYGIDVDTKIVNITRNRIFTYTGGDVAYGINYLESNITISHNTIIARAF